MVTRRLTGRFSTRIKHFCSPPPVEEQRVKIRVSGRAVTYFGSQSISNDASAIFELVKNSRDADAKNVIIKFENLGSPQARIIVEDDGLGMTLEDVTNKWLVAGTDTKVITPQSPGGRRVQGEKGIGRFACEKIAKRVTLESYPQGSSDMVRMMFDWDKYAKPGVTFDQVTHPLRTLKKDNAVRRGLCLTLEHLNSQWSDKNVRDTIKELGKFVLPKEIDDPDRVNITVHATQYGIKNSPVEGTITKNAPIKMHAAFENKTLSVKIDDIDDKKNERSDNTFRKQLLDKECGPFEFKLYFYPRETAKKKGGHYEKFYENQNITEFLEEYSGVYLYKDGAWVKPLGSKNDWLGLEGRRVQRRDNIGRSQVYGLIQISHDKNPHILSTSHRETVQENQAFSDLKDVIIVAIKFLKKYWLAVKNSDEAPSVTNPHRRAEYNIGEVIKTVKATKDQIPGNAYAKLLQDSLATQKYIRIAKKGTDVEIERFGELRHHEDTVAALGLFTSYMASAIAAPLNKNIQVIAEIRAAMESTDFNKVIDKETVRNGWGWIESLENNTQRMVHFTSFVKELSLHIAMSVSRDGKPVQFKVVDAWNTVTKGFNDFLKEFDIEAFASVDDSLVVEFSQIDLEAILTNLFLNSIDALKERDGPRRIRFEAVHSRGGMTVRFSDNGKGIKRMDLDRILEPFYVGDVESEGAHGHGLGLAIVKKIIERYDGDITPRSPSPEFSGTGTTIDITFPQVPRVVSTA